MLRDAEEKAAGEGAFVKLIQIVISTKVVRLYQPKRKTTKQSVVDSAAQRDSSVSVRCCRRGHRSRQACDGAGTQAGSVKAEHRMDERRDF